MPTLSVNEIAVLLEFFNYVDTNHDGFVTVAEIRAAVTDTNADGTIYRYARVSNHINAQVVTG